MAPLSPSASNTSVAKTDRRPGPRKLLELCEAAYTSFNPGQLTLDSHADECVKAFKISATDAEGFVRQVLYGVVRYKKLLGAFVKSFYHHNRFMMT